MNIEGMNEDLWIDLDCEEVKAEVEEGVSCAPGVCSPYCGCNVNCGCNGGFNCGCNGKNA
jgi:hypothetical protein